MTSKSEDENEVMRNKCMAFAESAFQRGAESGLDPATLAAMFALEATARCFQSQDRALAARPAKHGIRLAGQMMIEDAFAAGKIDEIKRREMLSRLDKTMGFADYNAATAANDAAVFGLDCVRTARINGMDSRLAGAGVVAGGLMLAFGLDWQDAVLRGAQAMAVAGSRLMDDLLTEAASTVSADDLSALQKHKAALMQSTGLDVLAGIMAQTPQA